MTDPRIQHAGVEARLTANGVVAADYHDLVGSLASFDDWCKVWCERGKIHEDLGREAIESRNFYSAGEHLSRAAATYHFAQYYFIHDKVQMQAAHKKAVDCLTTALPHLDPPGERVLIPYEGKHIYGVLRLPRGVVRPPIVLMTMGLESTKEELLTFQLNFLQRGMAILAFEGPGQGEAQYDFPIRHDFEHPVGLVIDWLKASRRDVDTDRIGMWGISLGGYYVPRTVAFEKRIKAAIANGGPYDWGALWGTLPELTRSAFVMKTFSKTSEEAREKAKKLSLVGVACRIECPLFVIGAGLDHVCPPQDARHLANEARGPVELLIVPDGYHVAHNRYYVYRGKSADWMAKQLAA